MNKARRARQKARKLSGAPVKRVRKLDEIPEYTVTAGLASGHGSVKPDEKKD